jgi:hypothetical protein
MWLSILVIWLCVCLGIGAAALGGYPLYWGFLAGWLCLPFAVVIAMLPRIVMDKLTAARRRSGLPPLIGHGRKVPDESFFIR